MTDLDKRIEQWYYKNKEAKNAEEVMAMLELLKYKFDFTDIIKVANACSKYGLSKLLNDLPFEFHSYESKDFLNEIIYKTYNESLSLILKICPSTNQNYISFIVENREHIRTIIEFKQFTNNKLFPQYKLFYDMLTDFTNNYKKIEYEFFKSVELAIK